MVTSNVKVSLRGSLASDVANLYKSGKDPQEISKILYDTLRSRYDEVVYMRECGMVVIGKKSDQGKYPPDW